ncbi:unnamed protein product [Arctogadus glacialis]
MTEMTSNSGSHSFDTPSVIFPNDQTGRDALSPNHAVAGKDRTGHNGKKENEKRGHKIYSVLCPQMRGVESGGETEPPEIIDWSESRIVKGKLISTAKQMAGRLWSPSTTMLAGYGSSCLNAGAEGVMFPGLHADSQSTATIMAIP